jgi:hypothetical protein
VIDDCNMAQEQRSFWLEIAESQDVDFIRAVIVNTTGIKQSNISLPTINEGFTDITSLTTESSVNDFIDDAYNKIL